jgi:hypothetical protein
VAKKARTPPPPRPVQVPKRREDPRARPSLGAVNRNVVAAAAGIVVLIGLAVGLWLAFGGGGTASVKPVSWSTLSGLQNGPPPWNNGSAMLPDRLASLGLTQLSAEGTTIHIHQHVDLYVNGRKVTIPGNAGIYANQWITELHTHQGQANIIHVESPTDTNYSLGQFFGVWGVRLTKDCVGRYCGAGKLSWWVNGEKQTGDPGQLVLKEHQEIAIAFGKPPKVIPKSFDFAKAGL